MRTAVVFTALLATASAQSIGGLSGSCTRALARLTFGDTNSCLKLTDLVDVISGDGSLAPKIDKYLDSLCSPDTPTCSNETLSDAKSRIFDGCKDDLEKNPTLGVVVGDVLDHYPNVYAALCSKNQTTDEFCVPSTIEAIQNVTGQTVNLDFASEALSGNTTVLGELGDALNSGQLCTGCVGGIYNDVVAVNASFANSTIGSTINGTCSTEFASANATSAVAQSTPTPTLEASHSDSAADSWRPHCAVAGFVAGMVLAAVGV